MAEIRTQPKRLVDLHPKWVETETGDIYGLEYDCPCELPRFEPLREQNGEWQVGPDGKLVGAVPYDQCCPRGGRECVPTKTNFAGKPPSRGSIERGWDLSGDSFENVTLGPSILAVGHWHGWLQNGVLTSC